MSRTEVLSLGILSGVVGLLPLGFGTPFYLSIFIFSGIHVLGTLGLALLMGYAGQVSLSQGAFMAIGAYTTGVLAVALGVEPWLGTLVGVGVTGATAAALGVPALKLHGHYLAMATLGFATIVYLVVNSETGLTGGSSGLVGIPKLRVLGIPFGTDLRVYYLVWGIVVALLAFSINLTRSRVGRALEAIRDSEIAASSLGVNTARYKLKIFVLSAMYASIGGSLYATYVTFISPFSFTVFFSIQLLVMLVIGGMSSLWGSVLGALVLTALPEVLREFKDYDILVYGGILMLTMMFLPEGLVSLPRQLGRFRRSGVAETPMIEDAAPVRLLEGFGSSGELLKVPVAPLPGSPNGRTGDVPLLQVDGVSMQFGGLRALNDVTFAAAVGKVTALIGPNGAGKTTLLNIISGLLSPSGGSVHFRGSVLTGRPAHEVASRGIARTFQIVQVFARMTVLDNIKVGCHPKTRMELVASGVRYPGVRAEEVVIARTAWDWAKFMGLDDVADRPAGELPLGLQRLVELARALAMEPQLLLLDEPGSGLNELERQRLVLLIRQLRTRGLTVLLVSHEMDLVMSLSDYIVVLHYGEVIAAGDPPTVRADPRVISAYLGEELQVAAT